MSQTYVVCRECQRLNRVEINSDKEAICGACKSELPIHNAIVEGFDSTLSNLIAKSPLPVIVDVWAPWCGPCLVFAPTFEEMSQRWAGQAVFAKLNSDENPLTAGRLHIRGIPTLIVFKNGKEIARQSGAMPSEMFENWLRQNVTKTSQNDIHP